MVREHFGFDFILFGELTPYAIFARRINLGDEPAVSPTSNDAARDDATPHCGIYDVRPNFWRAHTRTMTVNNVTLPLAFNVISCTRFRIRVMCICFHNSLHSIVFQLALYSRCRLIAVGNECFDSADFLNLLP